MPKSFENTGSYETAKKIRNDWSKNVKIWEKKNGRQFLWREKRTPYKVLISELLLKRTTSIAVARIYEKFLSTYPDIFFLAAASDKDLEDIFQDIGLYKQRSIQIKEMAEYLVKEFKGNIPKDYEALIKIPGIGDYTASAILVFGFGIPKAIVDSNVIRVVGRAFCVKGKKLRKIAEILVPDTDAVLYNYGLLDLGSYICHYKYFKCEDCPLIKYCLFAKANKD